MIAIFAHMMLSYRDLRERDVRGSGDRHDKGQDRDQPKRKRNPPRAQDPHLLTPFLAAEPNALRHGPSSTAQAAMQAAACSSDTPRAIAACWVDSGARVCS